MHGHPKNLVELKHSLNLKRQHLAFRKHQEDTKEGCQNNQSIFTD